jgi:hypothetical protein
MNLADSISTALRSIALPAVQISAEPMATCATALIAAGQSGVLGYQNRPSAATGRPVRSAVGRAASDETIGRTR